MARPTLIPSLLCITAVALPCCIAHNGTAVVLSDEQVIIVWNEKSKMQHFIRQAKFDTKAKDFGFIVPTPTVPDFAVADAAAYGLLESAINPPPRTDSAAAAGSIMAPNSKAEILKTEKVGDYEVNVVKATDGAAMDKWLKENGYVSRPAMVDWFDHYAKKEWVFSAFKFLRKQATGTMTQPIRVSFRTDQPHYPYMMPKDTWPAGHVRPLTVFFVADKEVQSRYVASDSSWEAKIDGTAKLNEVQISGLSDHLGLANADIPAKAIVTKFVNSKNEHGYGEDLYFAAASETDPRPFVGGGVAILTLAALVGRRKQKAGPAATS